MAEPMDDGEMARPDEFGQLTDQAIGDAFDRRAELFDRLADA